LRSGWIISGVGHAAILLFGLVTLASSTPNEDLSNYVPVAIVNSADISQVALGQQNAPKVDAPKPLADKIDEPKPVKQLAPKVADKPEITTDAAASKPEPKPDPKPADKQDKKTADFKPDQIADLLKKDETKKPPKPQDKPAPEKPAQDSPKFDADQVAALLDKREPQRQVATAEKVNDSANLGAATGAPDAQLSQDELDALRTRISGCWNPPAGVDSTTKVDVLFRVLLKPDGSLAQPPILVGGSASALGPALAESAKRALLLCQPFTMLKPEHYEQWKDIQIDFNPQFLLGG